MSSDIISHFIGQEKDELRQLALIFVHPNDEDKYSDRDNEKKDSGQNPVIQGVCIIIFGLLPVCQKSDTRGFESSPLADLVISSAPCV